MEKMYLIVLNIVTLFSKRKESTFYPNGDNLGELWPY